MEQVVHTGEALVDILRGVIDAVVVVPKRVHRLHDVAGAGMRGVNAGEDVRIVVVVELTAGIEEAWKTIRLRWSVPVMQVGRR